MARLAAELADARPQSSRLVNRRGLFQDLARAVAYRSRYGASASVLLADLDGLKPINDAYGHGVGDRVLAHVASLLRDNLRASDSLGRIGGDEFAMILWHADEGAARRKALALEAIIAGSPLPVSGAMVGLGASIGVASVAPGETADEVLARADRAMYARKTERKRFGRP